MKEVKEKEEMKRGEKGKYKSARSVDCRQKEEKETVRDAWRRC